MRAGIGTDTYPNRTRPRIRCLPPQRLADFSADARDARTRPRRLAHVACVIALLLGGLAGCTVERAPLAPDALRACLAVPDSTVWQVVDTAAFVAGVRRCLAARGR